MIELKSKLTESEKVELKAIIEKLDDLYADFYITKNNLRLFIKENLTVLFEELDKGDKIVYNDKGVIVINGFSDSHPRKYIKILSGDLKITNELLKVLFWNIKMDLFIKIKKNNPIREVLEVNGFRFLAGRGKEILMKRIINQEKENVRRDKN